MFGLKKQPTSSTEKIETPEQKEARERQERVAREVKIVSMPEKFRSERAVASKTKTVGMAIIAGAGVFLVLMAVVLYFFVFKKDNSQKASSVTKTAPVVTTPAKESAPVKATAVPTELTVATSSLPMATTTPEIASSTVVSRIVDYDEDGLSAPEEVLLSTSDSAVDSDGDGYGDTTEFNNLFNPAGVGKIDGNKNIARYDNLTYQYSILYPSTWAKSRVGGDDSIIFSSPDNNYIQMVAQANPKIESIEQWYLRQFGAGSLAGAENVSFAGWQGLRNKETGNYYLTDKARRYVFSLSYTSGLDKVEIYKNIFALMAKSLMVK